LFYVAKNHNAQPRLLLQKHFARIAAKFYASLGYGVRVAWAGTKASQGGGMGMDLGNKDFRGKDLRGRSFTGAIIDNENIDQPRL
jgi:hypothetical protein